MTREEIQLSVENEGHSLTFKVFSTAFGKEMLQGIYIPTLNWQTGEQKTNIDNLVTEYVTDCINNFIQLDKTNFIEKLKDEIFRLYIEATSYGQVTDNLIEKYGNTEANRIFFNGQNKETVFLTCNFRETYYTQDSGPELRYSIYIKIDWENEHGLTLFFENGELVNVE
jgi:hypothetical protein